MKKSLLKIITIFTMLFVFTLSTGINSNQGINLQLDTPCVYATGDCHTDTDPNTGETSCESANCPGGSTPCTMMDCGSGTQICMQEQDQ